MTCLVAVLAMPYALSPLTPMSMLERPAGHAGFFSTRACRPFGSSGLNIKIQGFAGEKPLSRNRCRIYRSNNTASPASVLLGSQPSHTLVRRSLQIRAFHLRWDGLGGCRGVGVGVGEVGVGGGWWGWWGWGVGGCGAPGQAWPGVAGLTYLQTICKPICKLHFKETHNCALSGSRKRQCPLLALQSCECRESL